MRILGLHGGITLHQHDAAAAIIEDGKILSVCEEERFSKFKSARGMLPIRAITAALKDTGLSMSDIDVVAHSGETYEDMPGRIEKYLEHYFGSVPKIEMLNHQLAHLASAYYCSGFDEAMVLSYDGFGDRLSAALARGTKDEGITILETRGFDNSLGDYYETITSFLGFQRGEGEYKVMGLSPYGDSEKYDLTPFLSVQDDGYLVDTSFIRNDPPARSVYEPHYSQRLIDLLGEPRKPGDPVTQRHKDIAASAQRMLEECAISLISHMHSTVKSNYLCIAGGVGLNCAANKKIVQLPFIDQLFVQPASSDRGLALGCALATSRKYGFHTDKLEHVYYGPEYTENEMKTILDLTGFSYQKCDDAPALAAELIEAGKIIGWFQGRAEFGPRALGNRSILADPRDSKMKDLVNAKIKFREEFRPFAPATTKERGSELFNLPYDSPFMTVTFETNTEWREKLGAVNHVNNTARVQTVDSQTNPAFHRLISEFEKRTGVPCVLNTSFNFQGQPIVETVHDALKTYASSGLDCVFIGPYLLQKNV